MSRLPLAMFLRITAFLAVAVATLWVPVRAARADGVRVRVRGTARIVAHASRDQGELVLLGSLLDDAGQPVRAESVTVHVERESDPRDPKVVEGLRAARPCDSGPGRPPSAHSVRVVGPPDRPEVVATTDDAGRFCFRARLAADRHVAHLAWRGAALVDGAFADLAFDLSRQALALRFDPTPRVVSLDTPKLAFVVAAQVEDDGAAQVQPGLSLVLANEQGDPLGRSVTDASGRARFAVEAARLGPPGPGALRASFEGNRETAFGVTVAEIERRVKVTLRAPAAEAGTLTPLVPEDGVPLTVDVASVLGPVSEGGVEAQLGDVVVGAAPVERGLARLTLTFAAEGSEALVRLRYVPSSPWFEPLGEPVVRVPIRAPGLLTRAPILAAGLAVLLMFLVGRVASKANRQPEPAPPKAAPEHPGRPRLDLIRAAARGEGGWRGAVTDAHDGTAVGGARVWIERGTFEGRTVLGGVSAAADGSFALPPIEGLVGGEVMAVEATLHARLVQPLPPSGELSIALSLRRRALLARLVSWARSRGRPFDIKPEPTPGHVRRAAGDDAGTARWAEAVERAAFGGREVDARLEGEIERMAPKEAAAHPGVTPPAPQAKKEASERR